mmetsp:Transcript_87432/g.107187  ORF Transcript_87432/g.107187 Transcript_87432/m.107187 type:complete len:165 (-) Transcript_87432:1409-1903(-)
MSPVFITMLSVFLLMLTLVGIAVYEEFCAESGWNNYVFIFGSIYLCQYIIGIYLGFYTSKKNKNVNNVDCEYMLHTSLSIFIGLLSFLYFIFDLLMGFIFAFSAKSMKSCPLGSIQFISFLLNILYGVLISILSWTLCCTFKNDIESGFRDEPKFQPVKQFDTA